MESERVGPCVILHIVKIYIFKLLSSPLRLIRNTIPCPCRAPPLPCHDSAVSFVKVRVVAGKIRTLNLKNVTDRLSNSAATFLDNHQRGSLYVGFNFFQKKESQ